MAYNVKFISCTLEQYNGLSTKDASAFYRVGTQLYLGEEKVSNAPELAAAVERIAKTETDLTKVQSDLTTLMGGEGAGSIQDMIDAAVKVVSDKLGDVDTLKTSEKTAVGAINEIHDEIDAHKTAAAVTIDNSADPLIYVVKQGEDEVGRINIPKDMVVQSGTVEVNPEGQAEGTYIHLILANATNDDIYINVGTLVDIYTVAAGATQVQLAMNGRELSATLVAGGVGTTELADNAVVTAKIADKNVTLAKLSDTLQASIAKADAALPKSTYDTDKATTDQKITDNTTAIATEKTRAEGVESGLAGRIATLETAIGQGGSVEAQIATAIEGLDATVSSAEPTSGQGLKVTVVEENGKLTSVALEGNFNDSYEAKGTVTTEIAKLDADITSTAVEAGKGVQVQVVEVDGKVTNVNVSGNYDAKYDAIGAAAAAQTAAATDAQTKATTAETNAKAYTDAALTWQVL